MIVIFSHFWLFPFSIESLSKASGRNHLDNSEFSVSQFYTEAFSPGRCHHEETKIGNPFCLLIDNMGAAFPFTRVLLLY